MGSILGGIISVAGGGGGAGGGSSSGIYTINGEDGPSITINSPDGTVDITAQNDIISLSASGILSLRAYTFSSITSGSFGHGLGTRDVLVQVYDNSGPPQSVIPDEIRLDTLNDISLTFNYPVSGRVVIVGILN